MIPVALLPLLWDLPVSVASAVFSFHDISLLDQEPAMFASFSRARGCSSPPSCYCSSQHSRKMSVVAVPGCCSHTFSFHMYEPFGFSINMQGPSLPSPTSLESSFLHIVNTKKQEIRSRKFTVYISYPSLVEGVFPLLPLPCRPLCPCPLNPVPSSAFSSVHPN